MSNVNEIIEAYKLGLEDGRKETAKTDSKPYLAYPTTNTPYPQSPYGGPEITYAGPRGHTPRVEYRTDGTYINGKKM